MTYPFDSNPEKNTNNQFYNHKQESYVQEHIRAYKQKS